MSKLITESYQQLNEQLHNSNETYGTGGWKWATHINGLTKKYQTRDVLDYGCGKSTLQEKLSFNITQYDPAILEFSQKPTQHDIVVCTDVLEHIEPECLDDVLNDLHDLAKKVVFLTVATRPACKTLADGRNTHLIIEDKAWWLKKLENRFNIIETFGSEREFTVIGTPA